MKKNINNFVNKAFIALFVLSLATYTSMAGIHISGIPTVTVSSAKSDAVSFLMDIPNLEKQNLQVVIRDEDGRIIFREFISKSAYRKVFQINPSDVEKVKFEVLDGKNSLLNNTYHLVRKVEEKMDVQLLSVK